MDGHRSIFGVQNSAYRFTCPDFANLKSQDENINRISYLLKQGDENQTLTNGFSKAKTRRKITPQ
jgi:hypothetical protein